MNAIDTSRIKENFYAKLQEEKAKKIKKTKRTATLVAAAILSLMSVSVLAANSDILDFSRMYQIVFGEKSAYVEQYIEPFVSESAGQSAQAAHESATRKPVIESEYDGIVMKLISAVNDEDKLHIFATLSDTTGDRLDESFNFTHWGLSQGHGGGVHVIDYNKDTKTATFVITSLGSNYQGSATLTVDGISTGRELIKGLPECNLNVGEILKRHTPAVISQDDVWKCGGASQNAAEAKLYETARLLNFDEMDVKLDSVDDFSITNMGFVDGLLHIQARAVRESGEPDYPYVSINFTDTNNKIIYDGNTHINFIEKKYAYANTHEGASGSEPRAKYIEMIYEDITNPEQLAGLSVTVDYLKLPETTEGHWAFSFPIPEKVTTEFSVGREIAINGERLQVDTVSLSPLGVTVRLPKNISAEYTHSDTAFVEYRDGAIVALRRTSIHGYETESALIFGGQIIELENVQSIRINDERINLSPQ